jgi:hypothetical protein
MAERDLGEYVGRAHPGAAPEIDHRLRRAPAPNERISHPGRNRPGAKSLTPVASEDLAAASKRQQGAAPRSRPPSPIGSAAGEAALPGLVERKICVRELFGLNAHSRRCDAVAGCGRTQLVVSWQEGPEISTIRSRKDDPFRDRRTGLIERFGVDHRARDRPTIGSRDFAHDAPLVALGQVVLNLAAYRSIPIGLRRAGEPRKAGRRHG